METKTNMLSVAAGVAMLACLFTPGMAAEVRALLLSALRPSRRPDARQTLLSDACTFFVNASITSNVNLTLITWSPGGVASHAVRAVLRTSARAADGRC